MATSRQRPSRRGRSVAEPSQSRHGGAMRGEPSRSQRASSPSGGSGRRTAGDGARRRSEGARVSAHERQQRNRERRQSRQDRVDGARGWASAHRRLLVCLAVVLFVVFSLAGPIRGYYVARRQSEDLQAYYDQLNDQNSSLDEDVRRLTSEDGIKDEARKRGYVEEGETSVEVEGLPEEDGSGQQQTDTRSGLTRFLDGLFGYTPKSYE